MSVGVVNPSIDEILRIPEFYGSISKALGVGNGNGRPKDLDAFVVACAFYPRERVKREFRKRGFNPGQYPSLVEQHFRMPLKTAIENVRSLVYDQPVVIPIASLGKGKPSVYDPVLYTLWDPNTATHIIDE